MHRLLPQLVCGTFMVPAGAESDVLGGAERTTEVAAIYTGEVWSDAKGAYEYLDNLDITFDVSHGQWTLFAYLLYNNGHTLASLADTVQGVSNIEAANDFRLYEAWGEWRLANAPLSLRAGLYDLNSEFDAIERGTLFVNPSHGIGVDFSQSGVAGPSIFPLTSLAVRVTGEFDGWTLRTAVLDGVPQDGNRLGISSDEGALLVAEVDSTLAGRWRVALGAWHYTADFEELEPAGSNSAGRRHDDNVGVYGFIEGPLWASSDGSCEVGAFMRAGEAEDRINLLRRYIGAGVVYSGLAPRRPEDRLGVAWGVAEPGMAARRAAPGELGRESIIELAYRFGVTERLTLQADVQHIRKPALQRDAGSTWMFGMRFELALL